MQRHRLELVLAILIVSTWSGSCATNRANPGSSTSAASVASPTSDTGPQDFAIQGHYVEACSCSAPCPCELVGPDMSCLGVGAYQFDQGSYGGRDFSGTRLAYALYIGKDVELYLDAPTPEKRAALEAFARHALAGFGPVQGARAAKVELTGSGGAYSILVDGGKVIRCTTEPVLGGDGKTALSHHNTKDALNPTMYQGLCSGGRYEDGSKHFELRSGGNSYFNEHMQASGRL